MGLLVANHLDTVLDITEEPVAFHQLGSDYTDHLKLLYGEADREKAVIASQQNANAESWKSRWTASKADMLAQPLHRIVLRRVLCKAAGCESELRCLS